MEDKETKSKNQTKKEHKQNILKGKRYISEVMQNLIVEMSRESNTFKELYRRTFKSITPPIYPKQRFKCRMYVLLNFPNKTVLELNGKKKDHLEVRFNSYKPKAAIRSSPNFINGQGLVRWKRLLKFMVSILEKTLEKRYSTNNTNIIGQTTIMKDLEFNLRFDNGFIAKMFIVPCILLPGTQWPSRFRPNPFGSSQIQDKNNEFLVTLKGFIDYLHYAISFKMQEKKIIPQRFVIQEVRRQLKRICFYFWHSTSHYALKTIFLWEFFNENPNSHQIFREPLKDYLIQILKKYKDYLSKGIIQDFWNNEINLLEGLSEMHFTGYQLDVNKAISMIQEIQNWNKITQTFSYND